MATIAFLGEGSSTTLATTLDSASITATSGRPLIAWFATSNLGFNCSSVTLDPSGTPQEFTRLDIGLADGANDCTGELWVLDAPSTVTAIVRATHANLSSARTIQVCEVDAHDTSTSTSWRDAIATTVVLTNDTTHEITITSATGDLPVVFSSVRNSASSPTHVNNAATSGIDAILGGTSVRGKVGSGVGAASVTLGGTTGSATQSVVMGFNINNASGGGSSIAAISAGYHNQGLR